MSYFRHDSLELFFDLALDAVPARESSLVPAPLTVRRPVESTPTVTAPVIIRRSLIGKQGVPQLVLLKIKDRPASHGEQMKRNATAELGVDIAARQAEQAVTIDTIAPGCVRQRKQQKVQHWPAADRSNHTQLHVEDMDQEVSGIDPLRLRVPVMTDEKVPEHKLQTQLQKSLNTNSPVGLGRSKFQIKDVNKEVTYITRRSTELPVMEFLRRLIKYGYQLPTSDNGIMAIFQDAKEHFSACQLNSSDQATWSVSATICACLRRLSKEAENMFCDIDRHELFLNGRTFAVWALCNFHCLFNINSVAGLDNAVPDKVLVAAAMIFFSRNARKGLPGFLSYYALYLAGILHEYLKELS